MAKVYEFLANGFEEIEGLAPVDILRRGGVDIKTVSITGSEWVETSHGVTLKADMRIEDFFDELDIDDRDFDDDNATIGGWAIEQFGHYPRTGDHFDYRNLTITVKKRKKLRVIRLLVTVHPVEEDAALGDD